MGTETQWIAVPFIGEGAGTSPMTWAQLDVWNTMARSGMNMSISAAMPMYEAAIASTDRTSTRTSDSSPLRRTRGRRARSGR